MNANMIGLDLAKNLFQVHGVDGSGAVVLRKRLRRSQVERFFAALAPAVVGLEACGGSHHWARVLRRLGHEVRLLPPAYVKPYVKRNKTDGRDAEAICEAMQRPTMRFVAVCRPRHFDRVRPTASRQPASLRALTLSSMAGSKRRSAAQRLVNSCGAG